MFRARDAPREVFTGNQAPLLVNSIAIAVILGGAKYGHAVIRIIPSQKTIIGNV